MSQSLQSHHEKILVIDDREDNLQLLSMLLDLYGYQVKLVSSGSLALEQIKIAPPDLILLDISMPEMSGYEVCRLLKNNPHTNNIPVIFISASTEALDKIEAFESGGSDYITKPFQVEEVIARVKNQLELYRLQTELKVKNSSLEHEIRQRQAVESKLLELNQKLSALATLDGLTQVANRRRFDEFFEREWRRLQREKLPLAIILCDIDHFKRYNDYFGHQAGDECLKQVARTIFNAVNRPADLVARYGGEEFVVILPKTIGKNALNVAEKIRLSVEKLKLNHPQSSASQYVSLSLGVASVVPSPSYNRVQLLEAADRCLYEAKERGRNRAVLRTID
ncbi:diguanylate cyclase [Myxosarcina sp. GI1]|uniref:diguanylate cyclase n=1 Tax=Myxosarcina sp. GI1 TaxID=1541065 RepID=UPI00056C156A|nr:diguanylate cyclase [Myxosarcina sp. GI1]